MMDMLDVRDLPDDQIEFMKKTFRSKTQVFILGIQIALASLILKLPVKYGTVVLAFVRGYASTARWSLSPPSVWT